MCYVVIAIAIAIKFNRRCMELAGKVLFTSKNFIQLASYSIIGNCCTVGHIDTSYLHTVIIAVHGVQKFLHFYICMHILHMLIRYPLFLKHNIKKQIYAYIYVHVMKVYCICAYIHVYVLYINQLRSYIVFACCGL